MSTQHAQVKTMLLSSKKSILRGHHSQLSAVGADYPHGGDPDSLVHSHFLFLHDSNHPLTERANKKAEASDRPPPASTEKNDSSTH